MISDLPADVEGIVDKAMKRIERSNETREVAETVFLWLLYAKQPLSLKEICEILTLEQKE